MGCRPEVVIFSGLGSERQQARRGRAGRKLLRPQRGPQPLAHSLLRDAEPGRDVFLAGDITSVALVVAVKGLGRYPELRENPGASERFVIGTLTSMIWAALVGVAGRPFLT